MRPTDTAGSESSPSKQDAAERGLMATDYLEVRGLTVRSTASRPSTDVDLTLFQGDLRFLIGPNGAGKTTVIDAITGLVRPPVRSTSRRRRSARQEGAPDRPARASVAPSRPPSVFEQLTVLQNLDIAAGAGRGA